MPRLKIVQDGDERVYEILDAEVAVGRGAANAIQLTGDGVSKHHAAIRRLGEYWKLVDLESRNGTTVNGCTRNQRWLRTGDTIAIGSAELHYDAMGAREGAPVVKAAAAVSVTPAPAAKAVAAKPAKPVAAKAVAAEPAAPAKKARPADVRVTEQEIDVSVPARVAKTAPAAAAAPVPSAPAPVASAPPASGAPGVSAPSRRRRDVEYDEQGRPMRRQSSNNGMWIGLGVLAGLLVFAFLAMKMLGDTNSPNRRVMHEGINFAREREFAKALAYAETHGDPHGRDYLELRGAMDEWRSAMQSAAQSARDEEA